jgi:hypothetical protein
MNVQASLCDDPFFFLYKNVKRVIAVARLRVAQPTYGTCPITCTRLSELHLTTEYNNQCAAEHIISGNKSNA